MIIKYENKKMIVTHELGQIDVYTKPDLDKIKTDYQDDIALIQSQIIKLDSQISEIDKT